MGIIKKFNRNLALHSLVAIYKSFVRLHLNYRDIIYDKPNNESFTQKIERIQGNAALAFTSAIKGTSQSKSYKELKNWKTKNQSSTILTIYNTRLSEDVTTFYSITFSSTSLSPLQD